MSTSFNRILVHAVWSTKYRQKLIYSSIEKEIHEFIKAKFNDMGCSVVIINGMPDHVHCLFLMSRTKSISEIIKFVKGSSSHYINERKLLNTPFMWQIGYGAFSVDHANIDYIANYIRNQKRHHKMNDVWVDHEIDIPSTTT